MAMKMKASSGYHLAIRALANASQSETRNDIASAL